MTVMGWMFVAGVAHGAPDPFHCGTADLVERHGPIPHWLGQEHPQGPQPDKMIRDGYGGVPNVIGTENFAIWWGNSGGVSHDDADALATNFEAAWALQVETQGYPVPPGADTFKFNVYIGDTGNGTPSAEGAAGYYYTDPAGYPMVVIDRDLVGSPESAKLTAAHEFFHGVQAGVGTYVYDETAAWWHEATANWIVDHVFPDFAGNVSTLYAIALRPEVPLNHFAWSWSGIPEDEHAYAAQVFATYLEENHGGWTFIRDTWIEASAGADPLEVIDSLLEDESIGEAHQGYAMKNATWDYTHGDTLAWWADEAEAMFPGESHRVSGEVFAADLGTWIESADFPPRTYGANYWFLATDLPSTVTVVMEPEAGIEAWIGGATRTGAAHTQFMGARDGDGRVYALLEGLEATAEAWIVVTMAGDGVDTGTVFPYRFRIEEGDQVPEGLFDEDDGDGPDPTDKAGCGCSTPAQSNPLGGVPWLVTLLLVGWARRDGHHAKR